LAKDLGLDLLIFEQLLEEGKRLQGLDLPMRQEPNAHDILMLGVTSGTTGEPKCALLSHLNFISGQTGGDFTGFDFRQDDVHLSYVPLTHVQEQICHLSCMIHGFKLGYSSGDRM
jgi:long-chain acyl-CoA synthetase